MGMTTKRPGAARLATPGGGKKTAPAKPASSKAASIKTRAAKVGSAKAAAHILEAAKGPRTVSHRKIKEAVEKVFRERSQARA
jgi:hypothetical protein